MVFIIGKSTGWLDPVFLQKSNKAKNKQVNIAELCGSLRKNIDFPETKAIFYVRCRKKESS